MLNEYYQSVRSKDKNIQWSENPLTVATRIQLGSRGSTASSFIPIWTLSIGFLQVLSTLANLQFFIETYLDQQNELVEVQSDGGFNTHLCLLAQPAINITALTE